MNSNENNTVLTLTPAERSYLTLALRMRLNQIESYGGLDMEETVEYARLADIFNKIAPR